MTAARSDAVLATRIKAQAYGVGFDLVGIVRLGPVESARVFEAWLARGYAGTMHYLQRGATVRRDTRLPVAGAASGIVVGMNYGGTQPPGAIARYARGADYHDVMTGHLRQLHVWLSGELGEAVAGRAYVDTGPILERDLARRAGLGWFGKNSNLINPRLGSFFFIGALFVGAELEPDRPFESDRCGSCRRCLDACPTDAFVAPRELNATRCISYLTIEHRGAIPEPLREGMGQLVYGCDICQDVCPWNVKFAREATEPSFDPHAGTVDPDLSELLLLTDAQFRIRFKGSPITRAKRRGLARNAAVALGNRRDVAGVPALRQALADTDSVVREHAAWALGRIGTAAALDPLRDRLAVEDDTLVIGALRAAIAASDR